MVQANVVQRKDGRWHAAVQVDGKRRFVYGKTEREARQKLAELRKQLAIDGSLPDAGRRTVSDLLDEWFQTSEQSLKPKTLLGYRQILAHVRPVVGSVRLAKLEPSHLQRLYNGLSAKGARTPYKAHLLLHAALRMAVIWGWLPSSPADRVIKPKYKVERKDVWTHDQLRAFLAGTAEHWLNPLFVTAVSSGCRLGELVGLRWEDVDLSAGTLRVRRNLQCVERVWVEGTTKTAAGQRSIVLPPEAVVSLRHQRALQAEFRLRAGSDRVDGDQVFTGQMGQPLRQNTVENVMRGVCKRLDLPPLTPHGLRHMHASLLLDAGLPVPIVSARLGHANPSVTMSIYAHCLSKDERQSADVVSRTLSNVAQSG